MQEGGAPVRVEERHASSGAQHPRDLADGLVRFGEVLQDPFAPDHVDRGIGHRKGERVTVQETGRAAGHRPLLGHLAQGRVRLDAQDVAGRRDGGRQGQGL